MQSVATFLQSDGLHYRKLIQITEESSIAIRTIFGIIFVKRIYNIVIITFQYSLLYNYLDDSTKEPPSL
jgi:hypothetical protein